MNTKSVNHQPAPLPDNWTFRRVVAAVLSLVVLALGFWLLFRFYQVIFILFISIVIGTVIRPAVVWFHQKGIPQSAAAILVYLLFFALIVLFVLILLPLVIKQGTSIAAAVPEYYQSLRTWVVENTNPFLTRLGDFLPPVLPNQGTEQQTGEQILLTAGQAFEYLSTAANSSLIFIAVLLLSFQWTINGPATIQTLSLLISREKRENMSDLVSDMEKKLVAYVGGQGILCLAIGIMMLVLYFVIGLPNALVLALIAAVFEAVPMIGPILGAIPAVFIAITVAPSKLILVIIITLVVQQIENSILVPRVMSKTVGVNPFVGLLAFFAFTSIFGIAGALMAIPLTAIIQLLLNRYVFKPEVMESEETTGRGITSRLRYETQSLAKDLRSQARVTKMGSDQRIQQTDQIMDEIETIAADLDTLLSEIDGQGTA